jgi:hypothetical protein
LQENVKSSIERLQISHLVFIKICNNFYVQACFITKWFVRLQGKKKILTGGIHGVFRGLKFFFNAANGQTAKL